MEPTKRMRFPRLLERGLGAALLVFGLFPVYRALDTSGDAPFRQASVRVAETTLQYAWWGSFFVILLAILLAFFFSDTLIRMAEKVVKGLCKPGLAFFAGFTGLLAFSLALGVEEFLYQGLYKNMDEIASAIQARYMASGQLAGPSLAFPEGWLVTNTLMVKEGWVSQYPPSHLAIMGLFFRLGIRALTGPVLMGVMAWLLALSFPRLLPGHEGTARVAALLTAMSPFLLFLAGGSLSHLTAGAAGAGILYFTLRAREGRALWGLAVGAAVGMMVCARPLVGLVLGTAFPVALWGPDLLRGRVRWALTRTAAVVAGGMPFAVLLGYYNLRLFGGITQFGYLEAFGRNHEMGFHLDPWGYMYGLESALAFTSIDLLAVGVQFLETPLPLTVAIGAFLLLGPRLPKGAGTVLAWALLPALANAFYWFHDPRMMFEAAPAWILLGTLGIGQIVNRFGSGNRGLWAQRLGHMTAWTVGVSLLIAAGWGIPNRWGIYSWTDETLERIQVPALPPGPPPIVFVHTSWNERLSSRLQGAGGMRQDSIVPALRRNTNCQLHQYADAREARARYGMEVPLTPVDLDQAAEAPEGLILGSVGRGIAFRARDGEVITAECRRELQADRFGAVALAPLLWQGDLPGDEKGRALYVRDLGPETNEEIRALFPDRPAYVFSFYSLTDPPALAPYEEAMGVLWGETPVSDIEAPSGPG